MRRDDVGRRHVVVDGVTQANDADSESNSKVATRRWFEGSIVRVSDLKSPLSFDNGLSFVLLTWWSVVVVLREKDPTKTIEKKEEKPAV
jgi:hypothetical protein